MGVARGASSRAWRCCTLWLLVSWFVAVVAVHAQEGDAQEAPEADGAEPALHQLEPRIAQIEALLQGTLEPSVAPQSLFDVALDDDQAVQVERARAQLLLQRSEPGQPPGKGRPAPVADAGHEGALWRARLALDRVRLRFYQLPLEQRSALLQRHAQQREAREAAPLAGPEPAASDEVEQQRQRSLAAAQAARTEAERLVAEEQARLLGLESQLGQLRERFRAGHAELVTRKDGVLGWQRRVRNAKASTTLAADDIYDMLRPALRQARDGLDAALGELDLARSQVPALGGNPLEQVPAEIATQDVYALRVRMDHALAELREQEQTLRRQRAASLLEEVDALNRERLGLLPHLSNDKRAAITGFSAAGLEQARSEVRHLLLILRYHRHTATYWLHNVQSGGDVREVYAWHVATVAVPWLLALMLFSWVRGRSPRLLQRLVEQSVQSDRNERRATPSATQQVLRFVQAVHRPLQLLLLLGFSIWLLPPHTRAILEVQLFAVIAGWTLAASLIVDIINALATLRERSLRTTDETGDLRLRSLRLVGRVVVVFGLVLVVSGRLVGEGTLYDWVHSTCWFAALPVFLILVKWWRETVFERLARIRRKSRLESWLLQNRSGWRSFLAAMIGAVQLSALGVFKTARNWLAGFDLARRAHAYLFKRELDRLAGAATSQATQPLPEEALALLSPARLGEHWVGGLVDEQLTMLTERVVRAQPGVLALVGDRGMGKTALLRRLAQQHPSARLVSCDGESTLTTVGDELTSNALDVVLLDDAHTLIKPVLGGLRSFDALMELARAQRPARLWIFAIDGAVWPFLRRARDSRPLFDAVYTLPPWSEDQIGELLTQRSAEAGISPSFEELLEKLPASADEVDKQEALSEKRAGYHRMVWDYARGNPGMALEVWRSSLVADSQAHVHVRPLRVPPTLQLESLPDTTLFVLRAVLQMSPRGAQEIAQATRLPQAQIESALHFARAHGYLCEEDDHIRIAWPWLRAVVVLLQRRHLLVAS